MSRVLRARIPRRVLWGLAGLLFVWLGEAMFRPNIGVCGLAMKARWELPSKASREEVVAWLDANGLPYRTVYDKFGTEFLWYLVRSKQKGSWLRSDADYWITFGFDGSERLSYIHSGLD